jgi:serine/threonine-protein kinase
VLHGQNFEQFMKAAEKVGGRLKVKKMLEIMRPIIDTLEAAHAQKIVHRDLKPSNIFVVDRERGGGVRLLDFGLVKMLDESDLTASGIVAGTPSYIAPEAWRGNPRLLDRRIDLYAVGVIVFRSLAGRVPFKTKSMAELAAYALMAKRPSRGALRPKLPAGIDDWVNRSLAIRPQDRFQSVRVQWDALEALLAGKPAAPF